MAMKGYRTPSWFRTKGRLKEAQAKAHGGKVKTPRKNGKELGRAGTHI